MVSHIITLSVDDETASMHYKLTGARETRGLNSKLYKSVLERHFGTGLDKTQILEKLEEIHNRKRAIDEEEQNLNLSLQKINAKEQLIELEQSKNVILQLQREMEDKKAEEKKKHADNIIRMREILESGRASASLSDREIDDLVSNYESSEDSHKAILMEKFLKNNGLAFDNTNKLVRKAVNALILHDK